MIVGRGEDSAAVGGYYGELHCESIAESDRVGPATPHRAPYVLACVTAVDRAADTTKYGRRDTVGEGEQRRRRGGGQKRSYLDASRVGVMHNTVRAWDGMNGERMKRLGKTQAQVMIIKRWAS